MATTESDRSITWGEQLRCTACNVVIFDGQDFYGCKHLLGVITAGDMLGHLVCSEDGDEWRVDEEEDEEVFAGDVTWELDGPGELWTIEATDDVFEIVNAEAP